MFSYQDYYDFIQNLKHIKSPRHRMVPGDSYPMTGSKYGKLRKMEQDVFSPGNDIKRLELSCELNNNRHHM